MFVSDHESSTFQMRDKLMEIQKQKLITLEDATIAIRDKQGKPNVKRLHSLVEVGALGGTFWSMLIGLLFFAPWVYTMFQPSDVTGSPTTSQ